jgi:hypothetical protein
MGAMANADYNLDTVLRGDAFVLKGADGYSAKRNTIIDAGSKYIYTSTSRNAKDWKLNKLANGWYNIVSVDRPGGCIYDSSGSNLAKFDRSCNRNEPRAEWKLVVHGGGNLYGQTYKVVNRKGRCLETDTYRERLKAVTCNGGYLQQFVFNPK